MSDPKLDALLEVVAENTTTLIDVQKQAAATSAASKDARTYVQQIAKQTNWDERGKTIALILTRAIEKDHTALHTAATAAEQMSQLSTELTHKTDAAALMQARASKDFSAAAQDLRSANEARDKLRWGRVGQTAVIGLLCACVGFLVRDDAHNYIFQCFLGRGYGGSIWYQIAPLAFVGIVCGAAGYFVRNRP